jgi:hypothetical protein
MPQVNESDDPELVPQEIVDAVSSKQCIVFLGAAANAPAPTDSEFKYEEDKAPPMGSKLSDRLADRIGYLGIDRANLQKVSLCAEFQSNKQWTASRANLVKFIEDQIGAPGIIPSPILHKLAALPFPFYITTNYDTLLEKSLYQAKTLGGLDKDPIVRVYDPKRDKPPEPVPLNPQERNPVVFKLHGDIHKPESIVVTEEDYLEFILKMTDNYAHPIPNQIRTQLNELPTLFIGYSLQDYNLRLLLRTLRWNVDPSNYKPFFSVDMSPDNVIVSVFQNRERIKVNFIRADVWKFVPRLYELCR